MFSYIPFFSFLLDYLDMDISEIRKENLLELIELKANGSQKGFALALPTAPAYISQIINGTIGRNGKPAVVGTAMARKIEKAFYLPNGYMDTLQKYDLNKTSSDARADKLESWVKTHYRNQMEFVEKFGLNQGEISNLIQKKRVLGERKARKLEEQTDMPKMYLEGRDESFTEVFAQNKLSARYKKIIDFCMNLDALNKNKSLNNNDLENIDIVLDNAIRTINEMVEKRIKPNQKKSTS